MSVPVGKSVVAIVDSKSLRRASLVSVFQQWANAEDLVLTPFDVDHACEALHSQTDIRMVIVNVGGDHIAEPGNLQTFMLLRRHLGNVPFIIISDRDDPQEIAAAVAAEMVGFVPSCIDANLACKALSFILHGGSYFPQTAIRQLQLQSKQTQFPEDGQRSHCPSASFTPKSSHNGHRVKSKLTGREGEVLERVRLGDSNKMIARELGMTEATVKVYVGQLMRKFGAVNRTRLALIAHQTFASDGKLLSCPSIEEKSVDSPELEKLERGEALLRVDTR